jgi:hypothetical protein
MSLILGILDSGGAAAGAPNSYESIATVNVGATAVSTITFSSIPQTYTHLQVRGIFKPAGANSANISFNGDTSSSNYRWHYIYGAGSGVTAGASTVMSKGYLGYAGTTTQFFTFVTDILDYTSLNKYKTVKTLNGYEANGDGFVMLSSCLWFKSSIEAINSITITMDANENFTQYSQVALYGIKGA